ncbi:hypothetical protein M408DRAFT_30542 [Serendipita vermifera MAFF 305830]|uniref:VIT domain-containing protein n=1 Tax=Serendipita vermifera MAFF 305830 TaxID=933852 RepID=A0A0C3A6G3_SERVB|nr:hypothetical protein M408DRAFT_30542 [Serendipita vermifera MAFF 305830]
MVYYVVGIIPVGGTSVTDEYPLVQSRCHYNVFDVYTIAEVVQDYHSNAISNREVEYVFPLPPGAAACAFKAVIDNDKVIKSTLKEEVEAKEEYTEVFSQGLSKFHGLLQQEHGDVFRVSLGNISPDQKISVHISFVSIISQDTSSSSSLRITIPTAIAPCYGVAPTNIPWFQNTYRNQFELTVAIQISKYVTSISSPSHPIWITLGCVEREITGDYKTSKAFAYLDDSAFLDKDVVIVISAEGLDAPRCTVERCIVDEGAEETTSLASSTTSPLAIEHEANSELQPSPLAHVAVRRMPLPPLMTHLSPTRVLRGYSPNPATCTSRYSPISPKHSPKYLPSTPHYAPISPKPSLSSPKHSKNHLQSTPQHPLTSPDCSPTSPKYSPNSPKYSATSPVYSSTSKYSQWPSSYDPVSPAYSPITPGYAARIPKYSSISSSYTSTAPPYSPPPPSYAPVATSYMYHPATPSYFRPPGGQPQDIGSNIAASPTSVATSTRTSILGENVASATHAEDPPSAQANNGVVMSALASTVSHGQDDLPRPRRNYLASDATLDPRDEGEDKGWGSGPGQLAPSLPSE